MNLMFSSKTGCIAFKFELKEVPDAVKLLNLLLDVENDKELKRNAVSENSYYTEEHFILIFSLKTFSIGLSFVEQLVLIEQDRGGDVARMEHLFYSAKDWYEGVGYLQ